ncbi:unnamed protein product [Cladocopium goreaui]|uniref:Alpha-latroinsectotoxin-Lt1a n=1 Tax=Cladocopium goreaui TaxID=2562237 RepID=A0A9P1DHM7_9DINO|nr:unnamed protein product [Cladocopium goreaui]
MACRWRADELRVLVIGAGLGTNAGLGLEVPLQHGKLLTDGSGGVVEISPEVRRKRVLDPGFPGFMGEEFRYLWEGPEGYLGNAGFIYGVLLTDPKLQVDMLQHPVTEADKRAVREAASQAEEVSGAMSAEAASLRLIGGSHSYASSIANLVNSSRYQVVLAASKGITQLLLAVSWISCPVAMVLLNGAEPPVAMDVGAIGGDWGPDFAELGRQFLAHPKVPRLVLTSHGAEVSAQLRKAAVRLAQEDSCMYTAACVSQRLALYSSLDHRCVPNRENHSLPWSLTFPCECWHEGFGKPPRLVSSDGTTAKSNESKLPPLLCLLHWAAGGSDQLLSLPQFPGPQRFAQMFVETIGLPSGGGRFSLATTKPSLAVDNLEAVAKSSRMQDADGDIYDIFFDAQAWEMQVVLKSVKSGSQTPVSKILEKEGQYATRRIRFFRYYEEKSRKISADGDIDEKMQWSQHMIHELLAMNKNLGNFLWTGFMTPATAVPRFGSDLMELVVEVELARLGGAYRGYSRGLLDAEHRLKGQYSLLGDCLDQFICDRAALLKQQRMADFNASNCTGEKSVLQFQEAEDQYFKSHCVKELDGYVRRELTIDHNIPHSEVQQKILHSLAELGMAKDLYACMGSFGHSSNFRFFVDGKAWFSAGCEQQDFVFVEQMVRRELSKVQEERMLSFLTVHEEITQYLELPRGICPPDFFQRNGYQVVAYRKFGNAGCQFLRTEGAWQGFSNEPPVMTSSQMWIPGFGPAEPRSKIFGHFEELPFGEIGRGGTTGRMYFYDTKVRHRSNPREAALWAAVQANQASWWEPQLYTLTAQDLQLAALEESEESLNFSCQEEFLKLLLRNVFEQELANARNLWLAGIQQDGVRKSSRNFPLLGSMQALDPYLEEAMTALVKVNIAMQEKKAGSSFSMGPTNAKRVMATGNFSVECREDICRALLELNTEMSTPAIKKRHAVSLMNRSLRSCADFANAQHRAAKEAFHHAAQRAVSELTVEFSVAVGLDPSTSNASKLVQGFRERLAKGISCYNTFTELQTEVNAISNLLRSA